jgi:hypothetical protein
MENCEQTQFEWEALQLRKTIKKVAADVKEHVVNGAKTQVFTSKSDISEMISNSMLAYRHLEDASMRLGKVIQAYDGGVSVYDKDSTVGCD